MKRNVILIGFMGTGKTTVGSRLKTRLNWVHIDTDREIEARVGMSIPDIFSEKGEAFFRDKETEVLKDILTQEEQIITTGGGIVLRDENARLMKDGGLVVALFATPEEIIRRVKHDKQRPLLSGDVEERVKRLLMEREGKYDFAPLQIDTSDKTVDEIVDIIVQACTVNGCV
ncbi:MAG: shikimate kinase [Bacillaceae bacterium]|nr:shikimate kinase [Bacillaceae bacterium]